MIDNEIKHRKRTEICRPLHAQNEFLLRSEVEFWRDLIESCNDTESPEHLERMQFALALAERRLSELLEFCPQDTRLESSSPSNVFHLCPARRD